MSTLITIGLIAAGLAALAIPWVGVAASYFIALLNPQSIWFWSFEGTRLVFWVFILTLSGAVVQGFKGRLNYSGVRNFRTFLLILLLMSCGISAMFAPYAGGDELRAIGSTWFILETLAKIILMVFVSSVIVTGVRELKVIAWMYAIVGMYLIYWINDRYLAGAAFGRVAGPTDLSGLGAYADENVFSTLFVTAIPFIFFLALKVERKMLRYSALIFIPFAWHAVFLTGSRGGMLALAVMSAYIAFRTKSRWIGGALIIALTVAFFWQGGSVLQGRMETLSDYSEDASANDRVNAWKAAASMIAANPLTGVGPGAFVRAFPAFSDQRPAQAHNTFLQFAAEFGILAGISYIGLILSSIRTLWKCTKELEKVGSGSTELLSIIEATIAAQIGCAVAAVFLSFQLFEPLYFLLFLTNVSTNLAVQRLCKTRNQLTKRLNDNGQKDPFEHVEFSVSAAANNTTK